MQGSVKTFKIFINLTCACCQTKKLLIWKTLKDNTLFSKKSETETTQKYILYSTDLKWKKVLDIIKTHAHFLEICISGTLTMNLITP
jgi:hypothetical protein